jgi:hypothetical protein
MQVYTSTFSPARECEAYSWADFHGQDAEYLKLQAFQHLLRLQVQALSKLWSLPDVFEVCLGSRPLADTGAISASTNELGPLTC